MAVGPSRETFHHGADSSSFVGGIDTVTRFNRVIRTDRVADFMGALPATPVSVPIRAKTMRDPRGETMMQLQARQILEISEDAGPEEIRSAYRRLARKHHPDLGGNPRDFCRIANAYQSLQRSGRLFASAWGIRVSPGIPHRPTGPGPRQAISPIFRFGFQEAVANRRERPFASRLKRPPEARTDRYRETDILRGIYGVLFCASLAVARTVWTAEWDAQLLARQFVFFAAVLGFPATLATVAGAVDRRSARFIFGSILAVLTTTMILSDTGSLLREALCAQHR